MTPAGRLARPQAPGGARKRCQAGIHPSHVPTEDHHVWPMFMGGPKRGRIVTLCANHHSLVHEVIRELIRRDGVLSVKFGARYGWRVRRLARQGYAQWIAAGRPSGVSA